MPSPNRTTNEEVVAAAQEILESGGLAALTMQAVAARVGVRAPSLYKRFHDRDALVTAVVAATVAELGDRLERASADLRGVAHAYRAFAHERPQAFRLVFTPYAEEDALRRASAPVLRAAAALVGETDALPAARLFTAWATGFLQMELAGAFRLGGNVDEAFDYGLEHLRSSLATAQP